MNTLSIKDTKNANDINDKVCEMEKERIDLVIPGNTTLSVRHWIMFINNE